MRAPVPKALALILLLACASGGPKFENCQSADCRRDWVLAHWEEQRQAVEAAIESVVDRRERDALILHLTEGRVGETEALCSLLSESSLEKNCHRLNARPHLSNRADDRRPPRSALSGDEAQRGFRALPNPFEGMKGRLAKCPTSESTRRCQTQLARRYVRSGSDTKAAASCAAIDDLKWRSECFFTVSEMCYTAHDAIVGFDPDRVPVALRFCLGAGDFRHSCLTHLYNRTAQAAARMLIDGRGEWSSFVAVDRALVDFAQTHAADLETPLRQRFWGEVFSAAYRERSTGRLPPVALREGLRGRQLVGALAYERWLAREGEALEVLVDELLARMSASAVVIEADATPDAPQRTRPSGLDAPPPGARRPTQRQFATLPLEQDVVMEAFLGNGRRPVSTDPRSDVALAFLESAAATKPVDHAFLASGLAHSDALVRWQAARLLDETGAPEAFGRGAGQDESARVRERIRRASGG